MKKSDPDECLVHCRECNGYLYAISRFEPKAKGQNDILVNCPYLSDSNDESGTINLVSARKEPYRRC